MSMAGRNEDWTGSQLAARLAALAGAAPPPTAFLLCRATTTPSGPEPVVFQGAGEPTVFGQQDLSLWLARHRLRGAQRLGLALLVIRDATDAQGLIRDCVLEYRRGALDGPLCGDPARVEFTGPARLVRFYRAQRDGTLTEIAARPDALSGHQHSPEQMAGELAAVRARYGRDLVVQDVREPTLLESMVGCDSILHIRLQDGREIGCGVGWHGPIPFVLAADFPRFGAALALPPEDEAAVRDLLRRDDLARHETRLDAAGLAVAARRRGTLDLLLLRANDGAVKAYPYLPTPAASGSEDQQNWMRYAETYEHLAILDAWSDAGTEALLVISGEASGQIWRHHIDGDGVETWRKPDDEAAAGVVYRERLAPGILAAVDARDNHAPVAEPPPEQEAAAEAPPDSLLTQAMAYVTAVATLHDAQAAAAGGNAPELLPLLHGLLLALETLTAEHAAAEISHQIRRLEDQQIAPERMTRTLAQVADRLPEELAARRLMVLAPAQWRRMADPIPFGAAVADAFPEAAYDIEEAALCLALCRPTAAVFHCMRALDAGLASLGARLGIPLPGEDRTWPRMMTRLRQAPAAHALSPSLRALEAVRRCWHGAALSPAQKYTEAEAERVFQAVGAFMAAMAESDPT